MRCNHCKRLFAEPIIIEEDPSPSGISLPMGTERYSFCPYCGDDDIDEFVLANAIEVSEGEDDSTAVIEFEGKKLLLSVSDDGVFSWAAC